MEIVSFIFILTSILIIISPGQDFVLVMSRSLAQGKKAGIITAFGVSIGLMGHTLLASLGLGTILMASELLFNIIKYLGAMYLIYLAYKLFTNKDNSLSSKNIKMVSYKKMFFQGAISNISNPKITIFYFSYLPQFIVDSSYSNTMQLFILGSTFAALTFLIKAPLAYLGGVFSFWIKTREYILKIINKTSGVVLFILGIKLAFEEK